MSSFQEITERFVSTIRRWGLNPRDIFEEFDKARCGFLSPDLFTKALVSTNFYCSPEDNRKLQNMYNESGLINYRRFLNDLSKPTQPQFEQTPDFDQSQLVEFGLKLQGKNLTVFDIMIEYDRLRIGHVPPDTFFRAFGHSPLVKSIVNQYTDNITREVNYIRLSKDIQSAILHRSNENKGPAGNLPPFFENFVHCIVSRNINLYDSFSEYDRYKRGVISIQAFLSIVSSFGIPLSPSQLQSIATPFADKGVINYKNFVTYVDKLAQSFELNPSTQVLKRESKIVDINSLLNEMKNRVEERRIQLRDQLETAAQEGRGLLSRQKFYKLLSYNGFTFSEDEVNAIDAHFKDVGDTMNVDAFLDRVDPIDLRVSPVDVNDVIRRLKNQLLQRGDSIVKHCAVYDRERSGTISLSQLISVFNSVDFHPTTSELNALSNKFGNGRFIQWKLLCNLVEPPSNNSLSLTGTASTTSTTIRQNLLNTQSPNSYTPPPPTKPIITFLQKVYHAAKTYNANIRDDLIRLDIRKCGLLNSRFFKEELESFPSKVTSSEIMVLLRPYFKPNTDQVCYQAFCDDLEKYGPTDETNKQDEEQTLLMQRQKLLDNTTNPPIQPTKAMYILKAALNNRRLSPEELFAKKDYYHTGVVPNECVVPSLEPVKVYLSNQQIEELMLTFRDKRQPEKFNYRRLCTVLSDIVPTQEDIKEINEIRRQASGENDGVQFITNELKNKLAERKKSVYDLFLNVNAETISPTQFRNRIEQAGIIVPENDMAKLIRRFRSPHSTEVNWLAFCNEVEDSQPIQYQSYR